MPYAGAIETYVDGLNSAARRGVLLELRISRPLYALGHGHRRSAAGDLGARPRDADRGAERPRRGDAADHRATRLRPRTTSPSPRRTKRRLALTIAKPGRVFTEEERSQRAVGVHRAARHHRAVPAPRTTPISASTARSATISPSSSTRSSYKLERRPTSATWCCILPDEILVVDHYSAKAWIDRYDYSRRRLFDRGPAARQRRRSRSSRPTASRRAAITSPANMPSWSSKAKESFQRGDLFEVVPGQIFYERCETQAVGDLPSG